MKMKLLAFTLLIVVFTFIGCSTNPKSISELKFNGIVAQSEKEPGTLYYLIGNGFNIATSASSTDSIVNSWIQKHPEALVQPIYAFGKNEVTMKFCLVFDGADTLNNYLIRQGCYEANAMRIPNSWNEIIVDDRRLIESLPGVPFFEIYLGEEAQISFQEQITAAENKAKKNKIGLWK